MEHLLLVGELKVIASGKGVDLIVADRDRLKLRRAGDYISLGGKFPRLTKKKPGSAAEAKVVVGNGRAARRFPWPAGLGYG